MPRAVWSGTLSFGLVTLPVRLFPATEPKDVRFHLYDERGRRVRYRRSVEDEPAATSWSSPSWDEDDGADASDASAERDEARPPRPPSATEAATSGVEPGGRELAWGEIWHGIEDPSGGGVVLVSRGELVARDRKSVV